MVGKTEAEAFIVVLLSSAPSTTVLAGTTMGPISSNLPAVTSIVVVPAYPSSTCAQAYLIVRHGVSMLYPCKGFSIVSIPVDATKTVLGIATATTIFYFAAEGLVQALIKIVG